MDPVLPTDAAPCETMEVTKGGEIPVNWSSEEVADVPPGVVTITSTVPTMPEVPLAADGLVTVICVPVSEPGMIAAVSPPMVTVASLKFEPVIVIDVPPDAGPNAGLTPRTTGGGVSIGERVLLGRGGRAARRDHRHHRRADRAGGADNVNRIVRFIDNRARGLAEIDRRGVVEIRAVDRHQLAARDESRGGTDGADRGRGNIADLVVRSGGRRAAGSHHGHVDVAQVRARLRHRDDDLVVRIAENRSLKRAEIDGRSVTQTAACNLQRGAARQRGHPGTDAQDARHGQVGKLVGRRGDRLAAARDHLHVHDGNVPRRTDGRDVRV